MRNCKHHGPQRLDHFYFFSGERQEQIVCKEKHRERTKAYRRKWRIPGMCFHHKNRQAVLGKNACLECIEYQKNYNQQTKKETFEAYGGRECVGCGETEMAVLSIDHVFNDGAKDRKEIGANIYSVLKKAGFPDKHRYQVLCMNCQFRKKVGAPLPNEMRQVNFHARRQLQAAVAS